MQGPIFELSGLFTSAFISSTIAPGGSEAVLAYLVSSGRYPVMHLLAIASIGNTLGAITTWGLGAWATKKFPLPSSLTAKQQKAILFITSKGVWVLLFSWLPIIGDVLCFAGGWLKLPFFPSCLLIFLGKLGRYAVIAWTFF